jgi:hypothetical protein
LLIAYPITLLTKIRSAIRAKSCSIVFVASVFLIIKAFVSKSGEARMEGEMSNVNWGLTGNSNTNPGANAGQDFLGTTDAKPLVIATDGTEVIRVQPD